MLSLFSRNYKKFPGGGQTENQRTNLRWSIGGFHRRTVRGLLTGEFCLVIIHPLLNFRNTQLNMRQTIAPIIVGMIHCHIQLCVICIRMMRQSIPLNEVTNRCGVHAINLRTQNRTLWDSKVKLLIYGYSVYHNYTLYPTGEIRPEPIKCIASYTVNITQSGQ